MTLHFSDTAWEDYLYWQSVDRRKLARINTLIEAILRSPFEGIGKPERLRFDKSHWWSRRIDLEHRIVYRAEDAVIFIAALRYHYHVA